MAQGHIQIDPVEGGFKWTYSNPDADVVYVGDDTYLTSTEAIMTAGKHYPNVPFDVSD